MYHNHTSDSSSDFITDNETHKLLPDIYTTMFHRGVLIDPSQMSPFPPDAFQIPMRKRQQSFPMNQTKITFQSNSVNPSLTKNIKQKRKETRRTLFSNHQRSILLTWLKEHQKNPYPTSIEKQQLMEQTGLNRDQINVWFTNNRVRHGISSSSHHNRVAHNQHFFR